MIAVVAHSRSGTGYAAKLFQSAGMQVGHEFVGTCGISSWMWAVQTPWTPWGDARGKRQPDKLIHLLRDPVATVPSVAFTDRSETFRRRFVWIPHLAQPVEQAVFSWIGWNRLIAAQAPDVVVTLDGLPALVAEIAGREPENVPPINTRQHEKLTELQIRDQLSVEGSIAWQEAKIMWSEAQQRETSRARGHARPMSP